MKPKRKSIHKEMCPAPCQVEADRIFHRHFSSAPRHWKNDDEIFWNKFWLFPVRLKALDIYRKSVQLVTKQKLISVWFAYWINRNWFNWWLNLSISTSFFYYKLNRNASQYAKQCASAPCQVKLDRIFYRHFSSRYIKKNISEKIYMSLHMSLSIEVKEVEWQSALWDV